MLVTDNSLRRRAPLQRATVVLPRLVVILDRVAETTVFVLFMVRCLGGLFAGFQRFLERFNCISWRSWIVEQCLNGVRLLSDNFSRRFLGQHPQLLTVHAVLRTEKSAPSTLVKLRGRASSPPELTSSTISVPIAVPSLFHNSTPLVPSSALK